MKNFRDIAQLNMKKGLLFRSEALSKLSKKDKKLLIDKYNIKVVVDLRTKQEHDKKPDVVLPGVIYLHLPLITMEEMGSSSEKEAKVKVIKNHKLPDIFDYYNRLVSYRRKESWTKIFELLLNNQEGGILFHCTAGKDRTGVVSAAFLTLFGVNKEIIYEDYLLTNKFIKIPFSYKLFALSLDKKTRKEFIEYFKAKTEYLDSAFDQINETWGSMNGFFKDCCSLDEDKIKQLKEKYLNS